MKKKTTLAAFALLMLFCGAIANGLQTVLIGGQDVDKQAARLTFSNDSVTLAFTDATTQTASMEEVELKFDWTAVISPGKQCDVNGDGAVDVADIATVISVMAEGVSPTSPRADVNGDGAVDVADIASIISAMAGGEARRAAEEAAQAKWDFTQTPDQDILALSAATGEWSYDETKKRYENTKAISGALKAAQTELLLTKGLSFEAAEKKMRIDVNSRLQLAGKGIPVTTPALQKGQRVTIVFASTGTNAVTFDANTNLANASGFVAADKDTRQTGTATVEQNGPVSFKSTGGSINIYSIEIEEAPDDPADQDVTDNAVSRDTQKNQAIVTLGDGIIHYYNTDELMAIDIDNATGLVTMSMNNQQQDLYHASVSGIAFAKKQDTGQDPVIENGQVDITEANGWMESLYVKWGLVEGVKNYNVYYSGSQQASWEKADPQLVRNYGTYGRADIVGLTAGTYAVKVVAADEEGNDLPASIASTVQDLVVKSYPRQGFAFMHGYAPGAYNADGTLKQGAKVFYVTKNTAKTIQTSVVTSAKGGITECTGLQAIIAAYEKGCDTTPIAFRFIGLVEKDHLDAIGSSEEGIQVKGRKADSELNMTFEGIGDDATLRGFGFLVRNAKGVEFRNLGIMRCMDDGISMDTDNSNIWVHHCDFFYGKHGSGDHDKGDGQVDVKSDSKLITVSYNRFWDTGKTNMFGMKSESGPNYISYDHNWFDHSDSRHPRVRTMSVHVWNNYFDNVAKYGVGATTGASVFVESNYFLKTKKPILSSLQGTDGLGSGTFSGENGGMIKAFGNYFDRSAVHFSYYTQAAPSSKGYDAYETQSRDEQVPATETTLVGGTSYNNFDTNPQLMYQYTADAADDVPAIVTGYYGAGRLNHGDFTYTFADNVGSDDDDSAYDSTLGDLIDGYKSSLVGLFTEQTSEEPEAPVDPADPTVPTDPAATILASFDGSPSNSMFTVGGDYGDGKITYAGTYYKKGVKLNSKGSVTFTPQQDYLMTLVLTTAKPGRDVSLNGTKTTVTGTENTEGAYYEMDPIAIAAGTKYVITKGSEESILMLIKLQPAQ